jgi:error-prone DNA polymerase
VVAEHLTDLSDLLRGVGERDDEPFPLPHGRGDEARHGSQPDSRDKKIVGSRDMYVRDLSIVPRKGIKVPTRDFR